MILIDTNLLVYAYVNSLPQHDAARRWLDARLNGTPPVGLPWPSLLGFVRLVSNPRVFRRPVGAARAWEQAEAWLGCTPTWVPTPTDGHRAALGRMMPAVGTANDVPDAHLAALAVEHGLLLCSTDQDFAKYPGLRWENPLV